MSTSSRELRKWGAHGSVSEDLRVAMRCARASLLLRTVLFVAPRLLRVVRARFFHAPPSADPAGASKETPLGPNKEASPTFQPVLRDYLIAMLRAGTSIFALSFLFNSTYRLLLTRVQTSRSTAGLLAGLVSSAALFIEHPRDPLRTTVPQMFLVRALQAYFNRRVAKSQFVFGMQKFAHADMLLMMLTCGQVMFSYVLHPKRLPYSYYTFIQKTGPIPEVVLRNMRRLHEKVDVDVEELNQHLEAHGAPPISDPCPETLECHILHPEHPSCLRNQVRVGVFDGVLGIVGFLQWIS